MADRQPPWSGASHYVGQPMRGSSSPGARGRGGQYGSAFVPHQGGGGGLTEGRGGRGQGQRFYGGPGGADQRPYNARGGLHASAVSLMEDGPRTKLSSHVTPHDAVQAQPAQHGASVVRSGSAPTEGGSILFFSSVQKKGGAFTASERETYAQLHRSRAIPNTNRGRNAGSVTGSGVSAKAVARQYADLERDRDAQALVKAQATVAGAKRSRFALENSASEGDDGEDEEDGEGGSGSDGDDAVAPPAKRPASAKPK